MAVFAALYARACDARHFHAGRGGEYLHGDGSGKPSDNLTRKTAKFKRGITLNAVVCENDGQKRPSQRVWRVG